MSASKGPSRDSARFVTLFQKAHSHVASLQRVDDQIAALFEQRRRSLEDLRAVQAQINAEFERVFELDRVVPANGLTQSEDEETAPEPQPMDIIREAKISTPPRLVMMTSAAS
jgi:hypothetical protein